MMNFLCIGGPLDGKKVDANEARENRYCGFNCESKYNRTKMAIARAKKRNAVIPPGKVWVHVSILKNSYEEA